MASKSQQARPSTVQTESPKSSFSRVESGSGSVTISPPPQTGPAPQTSFSTSVENLKRIFRDKPVSAWAVVIELLKSHGWYAKSPKVMSGVMSSLQTPTDAENKLITEWLAEVRELFDEKSAPEIHGKNVIIGLGLLVPLLSRQLSKENFLSDMIKSLKEPLLSILSPRGQRLYLNDTVSSHPDHPAEVDHLGRMAFAEALAIRLRRLADEGYQAEQKYSFMLNINGPWGAGKSTLLKFLSRSLKDDRPIDNKQYPGWVIVEFNAWQHQRIGLPWWSLMNAVFRQALKQLWVISKPRAVWFWLREYAWRLRVGRGSHFLIFALVFWALVLFFYLVPLENIVGWLASSADPNKAKTYGDTVELWSKLIALVSTVGGAIIFFTRSIATGTTNAARHFMYSNRDPMNSLTSHFADLVERIKRPVAIFIDDLDRCRDEYVVDLMEGIQTLFRETAIVFVVAADRRWLCSSYTKAYQSFSGAVDEPGRPLGYLFLDKIFQLSTSVPRMSPDMQRAYWTLLLSGNRANKSERLQELEEAAQKKVQEIRTEAGLQQAAQDGAQNLLELQKIREAAVIRLASQEVEADIEHALKSFAPLLEPNPRAMKRLLNAYAVQRAVATLAGVDIKREQLALWTIASLRWPVLAEYLEDEPKLTEHIGKDVLPDEVRPDLQKLFKDPEVISVFRGVGIGEVLDESAVTMCASLRTTNSSNSPVA
ncbi:MAG: hypothetical protein ICV60_17960 [Pyrinomonadaceae bacterium]|nr:hypothetical protein [Pyrinomonadaceae bacterium]